MIREKNLEAIKNRDEGLYEFLISYEIKNKKAEAIKAKNGEIAIKYDGIVFNSLYNPTRESEKFMSDYSKIADGATVVMIGISNGMYIRRLIESNEAVFAKIIYEPSTEIFIECINNIDISDIITLNTVDIVLEDYNGQKYKQLFDDNILAYNFKLTRVISLPRYSEIFKDKYSEFIEAYISKIMSCAAIENTAVKSGKLICENSINNIKYIHKSRRVTDYKGLFGDIPAILVAAGPSLEKNVHLLNEIRGRALIIAVDSALPFLMSKNIVPDMFIAIDYQKPLKLFEDARLRDVPFVFDPDFNNEVLKTMGFKNLIIGSTEYNVWNKIANIQGDELNKIETGGSVATNAISVLTYWGIKNIILIGQDLALSDGKAHAGNVNNILNRKIDERIKVKGINEEYVETQKDYYVYLKWIENYAYKVKEYCTIIDATEGGALKENTIVMTLRDAIDKYCNKEYNISELLLTPEVIDCGRNYSLVIEELENMILRCRNLNKMCASGAADCKRAKNMLARQDYDIKLLKKINASMAKLDNAIEFSEERDYYIKYSYDIEVKLGKDVYEDYYSNDIEESIKLYENTAEYYNGVEKAGREIVSIAQALIEELKKEEVL